jgi:hypothetical protein
MIAIAMKMDAMTIPTATLPFRSSAGKSTWGVSPMICYSMDRSASL